MENIFGVNGIPFWSEAEIKLREHYIDVFERGVRTILTRENPAWQFVRVEAPLLTPPEYVNRNYTRDDVFFFPESYQKYLLHTDPGLVLRPETTPGSYAYAQHLFNTHSGYKPPVCVWQAGKSFRREQDQVTKNMRLKEFYQMEFQCIYAADTKNDYLTAVLEPVRFMIASTLGYGEDAARVVPSDRLPSYSEITMDVEINNGEKWMEVCSISLRTDFPQKLTFQGKSGLIEKDALVLEIAIGLDRCLYNFDRRVRYDWWNLLKEAEEK